MPTRSFRGKSIQAPSEADAPLLNEGELLSGPKRSRGGTRNSSAPDVDNGAGSVKWSQERRLQFIDFRLQWAGRINRRDVMDFFKISVPQASADIARYAELAPNNLEYDPSSRMYIATAAFSQRFESSGARQYLSQLLALERQILSGDQAFLAFRPPMASVPLPTRTIESKTLALMLRAIAERAKLQIKYQSIARDEPQQRFISPHAFGYDGVRWHVRAFCHLRNGFRDFVFGRVSSPDSLVPSEVDPVEDREWHTVVDLVLVPDTSLTLSQRRGVEVDYGMENGSVTISCRQAMLFYTLRTLNFESNGLPRKGEKQLLIANLADIKSLLPRPGQA
jgi:predicted DNA-binding transcriptional regulator YafY